MQVKWKIDGFEHGSSLFQMIACQAHVAQNSIGSLNILTQNQDLGPAWDES